MKKFLTLLTILAMLSSADADAAGKGKKGGRKGRRGTIFTGIMGAGRGASYAAAAAPDTVAAGGFGDASAVLVPATSPVGAARGAAADGSDIKFGFSDTDSDGNVSDDSTERFSSPPLDAVRSGYNPGAFKFLGLSGCDFPTVVADVRAGKDVDPRTLEKALGEFRAYYKGYPEEFSPRDVAMLERHAKEKKIAVNRAYHGDAYSGMREEGDKRLAALLAHVRSEAAHIRELKQGRVDAQAEYVRHGGHGRQSPTRHYGMTDTSELRGLQTLLGKAHRADVANNRAAVAVQRAARGRAARREVKPRLEEARRIAAELAATKAAEEAATAAALASASGAGSDSEA